MRKRHHPHKKYYVLNLLVNHQMQMGLSVELSMNINVLICGRILVKILRLCHFTFCMLHVFM